MITKSYYFALKDYSSHTTEILETHQRHVFHHPWIFLLQVEFKSNLFCACIITFHSYWQHDIMRWFKRSPNAFAQPLLGWTVDTRLDGAVVYTIFWPYHLNATIDSSNQTKFSNFLLSTFGEPMWIVASASLQYLVWFLLLLHICLKVERCSSAYLGCNEWLSELVLTFYQMEAPWPFSSDLWKQQEELKNFFSINCRDGCMGKP